MGIADFFKKFLPSNHPTTHSILSYDIFYKMADKAISRAKRTKTSIAILLIDIDKFRNIPDKLGVKVGKQVINMTASRIIGSLRDDDIAGHIKYDKFIILLDNIPHPKFAGAVSQKILEVCEQPIVIDGINLQISVSIGICLYQQNGRTLDDLLNDAAQALLAAKNLNGNTFKFFDPEMEILARDYNRLKMELTQAIHDENLTLFFQPQLCLKDHLIKRAEALIRWNHPEQGIIEPDKFIPLAESTGLILPIGEWTIMQACLTIKKWIQEKRTPIIIAVNISPIQFTHQDIPAIVSKALNQTGIPAHFLELEITESTIMGDVEAAVVQLKKIAMLGVVIAIDDFGVGYTSIGYLKKFPIEVLKVDQSFVRELVRDKNDSGIVKALIDLGHSLDLIVVAEGVETVEQMEMLEKFSCDYVQGTYISPPIPEPKLLERFMLKA